MDPNSEAEAAFLSFVHPPSVPPKADKDIQLESKSKFLYPRRHYSQHLVSNKCKSINPDANAISFSDPLTLNLEEQSAKWYCKENNLQAL